jgi:hypothetical protein
MPACTSDRSNPSADASANRRSGRGGTAIMADTLAAYYARALAAPGDNPFLNSVRADAIKATLARAGGTPNQQEQFRLAQELVLAGRTREGIDALEAPTLANRVDVNGITAETKPYIDLLAIANLRLGEQENCLGGASNVCAVPLDGAAPNPNGDGARKAIELYQGILRAFPDDRGSQWLLNMAYLAVGGYPDSVPAKWLVPGLRAKNAKSFPVFPNIAAEVGLAVNGLSGGLAIEDFDGDGLLDLFMTSSGMTDPIKLFLADGRGGYTDASKRAGIGGITGGANITHADYDNDGLSDVFVMRGVSLSNGGAQPNSLLHNKGHGLFEDVTIAAGLLSFHPTRTAAWADFNVDGHLDLFVGNESGAAQGRASHRSELFMNNGNGTFTEVSHRAGIDLDALVSGTTWGDVNNDGLPDLYASVQNGPNKLYVNKGGATPGNWRFEERAAQAGIALPNASSGTWFWDVDQDGWQDLMVLSYDIGSDGKLHDAVASEYLRTAHKAGVSSTMEVESSRLYRNNRDGTFTDVTREQGLADRAIFAIGHNFGDLDNDGWLDFHVGTGSPDLRSIIPNRMFRSVEGRRFEEVSMEGGFAHIQKGGATAFADFDRDGDEDLYVVMGGVYQGDVFTNILFENPGWPKHAFVNIELQGKAANRSAIGARVAIDVVKRDGKTRTLHRTVSTGGSFGAGSLSLHVGLGDAARIERVRVVWPDSARTSTVHVGFVLGASYRIVQGAEPELLQRAAVPFNKMPVMTRIEGR